jgi:hypothetical protein
MSTLTARNSIEIYSECLFITSCCSQGYLHHYHAFEFITRLFDRDPASNRADSRTPAAARVPATRFPKTLCSLKNPPAINSPEGLVRFSSNESDDRCNISGWSDLLRRQITLTNLRSTSPKSTQLLRQPHRKHGWTDIQDDGQDLRVERDAAADVGS